MKNHCQTDSRRFSIFETVVAIVMICIIVASVADVAAQAQTPVSHLDVDVSLHALTAGFNNTVTFEVLNRYEDIFEVDITLTIPSPLAVLGDNHWRYPILKYGDSLKFDARMFVPKEAGGNAYSSTLTIMYKRLGYVATQDETHIVGFSVRGWIDMIMYGLSAEPQPASPGSVLTITANLLNQGNTPALYTNVTVLPQKPIMISSQSVAYVGQIDPNSPAPFTLQVGIDANAAQGAYTLVVLVTYKDDQNVAYSLEKQVPLEISQPVGTESRNPAEVLMNNLVSQSLNFIPILATIIGIGVALFMIVRRRRTKKEQTGEEQN